MTLFLEHSGTFYHEAKAHLGRWSVFGASPRLEQTPTGPSSIFLLLSSGTRYTFVTCLLKCRHTTVVQKAQLKESTRL